eukprot:6372017-Prymnesium_polylepis.1
MPCKRRTSPLPSMARVRVRPSNWQHAIGLGVVSSFSWVDLVASPRSVRRGPAPSVKRFAR